MKNVCLAFENWRIGALITREYESRAIKVGRDRTQLGVRLSWIAGLLKILKPNKIE